MVSRTWKVEILRGVVASLRGATKITVAMGTVGAGVGTPCAVTRVGEAGTRTTISTMTHDVACARGVPLYRVTADDVSFDIVADGGAWS